MQCKERTVMWSTMLLLLFVFLKIYGRIHGAMGDHSIYQPSMFSVASPFQYPVDDLLLTFTEIPQALPDALMRVKTLEPQSTKH